MNLVKENRTISKVNAGFPTYLDFEKLREAGIQYLGKLSGKIWTDHNVHDPGITTLEVLCYALIDLGYRTNLPTEDIFARDPEDNTRDNNFLTPAQVLTCNPLTFTDFRKLLVDIEEVKNAWLEVAIDENAMTFCPPEKSTEYYDNAGALIAPPNKKEPCINYLNGLYHVYIDTEINIEKEFRNDPGGKAKYTKTVTDKVKEALMAHRNLCEDFIDIKILCRQEIGVCVELELEGSADAETVFLEAVEKLQDYFSPAPRFYTLQQLLEDKKRTIEEIFAGRPFNITQSHGFVDTEEFEKIKLKKEIHISDVFAVLLKVKGVIRVQNLRLRNCASNSFYEPQKWIFPLLKNHVPEFSLSCSGFTFTRSGVQLNPDLSKFKELIDMGFRQTGKILYKEPSPYLNNEIPKGVYRPDIADYNPIQNEFPRVYGIAEGGLSSNASKLRKSQALQLKGYLLFFDQLLANYLSQIKNIRSLFSLSPLAKDQEHTYFVQQPGSGSDLQSLIRFKLDEEPVGTIGNKGTILARLVSGKHLQDLADNDRIRDTEIEKDFPPYYFESVNHAETAMQGLQNDLIDARYDPVIVSTHNDCYFFYLFTSSCEFALLSRRYYKNEQDARTAAASLLYAGTFNENYHTFIHSTGNSWSFNIELNLSVYEKYLQLIAEDEDLFYKRRSQFLNHLLARFAESFTDFALLNYGFTDGNNPTKIENATKERFLSIYDDLSSNRGKAYDYRLNGWNNNNVSGTEKRFKALAGIENLDRHSLCHFEVHKYEPQYVISLKIGDQEFFNSDEKFETKEDAIEAAQLLFKSLGAPGSITASEIPYEDKYGLQANYGDNKWAHYHRRDFESREAADNTAKLLYRLFSNNMEDVPTDRPDERVVVESRYRYQPYLLNYKGVVVAKFADFSDVPEKAHSAAFRKINERGKWEISTGQEGPKQKLYYDKNNDCFIDYGGFDIVTARDIMNKPGMYSCEVFDFAHIFKFRFVKEFDNSSETQKVQEEVLKLLLLLPWKANYKIDETTDGEENIFIVSIIDDKEVLATYTVKEIKSEQEAEDIISQVTSIVGQQLYHLDITQTPDRWKFRYRLGFEVDDHYIFESEPDLYEEQSLATKAAQAYSAVKLKIWEQDGNILLGPEKVKGMPPLRLVEKQSSTPYNYQKIKGSLEKFISIHEKIKQMIDKPTQEDFENSVVVDKWSECGEYVYRLVDNDNLRAFSPVLTTINDKAAAELQRKDLIQRAGKGYGYLEIAAGKNAIHERKDPETNRTWYHYQIKPQRRYFKEGDTVGMDLVLFESTRGYGSIEDAENAFRENYLLIIHYATDLTNYGDQKPINDNGRPVYNIGVCFNNESLVFIPQETLDYLGDYTEDAERELVRIAKSYPVRMIHRHSSVNFEEFEEFNKRFPCDRKDEYEGDDNGCDKEDSPFVYYFTLFNKDDNMDDWQSVKYYSTAKEVWAEFYYFHLLLRYTGNYFVTCDPCHESYKVYIREVLAESTQRFPCEKDAWGSRGLQKFICIAQTENAFHTQFEKCCYSFYTACHSTPLIHPCLYDNAKSRDDAIEGLYRSYLSEGIRKLSYLLDDSGTVYLIDGDDRKQAEIVAEPDWIVGKNDCDNPVVELIWLILTKGLCINDNYGLFTNSTNGKRIQFKPIDVDETLQELKKRILCLAWYFPIVRRTEIQSGNEVNKYCIELKFGDYECCDEKEVTGYNCSCGDEKNSNMSCHVSWKSKCCYNSCEEAIYFYNNNIKQLLSHKNDYRATYECGCGPYGISLHHYPDLEDCLKGKYGKEPLAENLIVAINPQCYPDSDMACRAVERTKKLINAEGLHLVEHILLRPHCVEPDCECDYYKQHCENKTDCEFQWEEKVEDPCDESDPICFVPGYDPYSFIATIALPAWPARFRKKENRKLIEMILRREAPAHILLRILWLAPHDWCCFESHYKKWGRWLALKGYCGESFNNCDWLHFLFNRNYECFCECNECLPCNEDKSKVPDPCSEKTKDEGNEPCMPDKFLSMVNNLFCWKDINCEDFEYFDCSGNKPEKECPEPQEQYQEEEKKEDVAPTPDIDKILLKSKRGFVNQRLKKYKEKIHDLAAELKGIKVVGKVKSFLDTPSPEPTRLQQLIEDVLQQMIPASKTKKAPLGKKHAEELLKTCIHHYLDKVCFNDGDLGKMRGLAQSFSSMKKAGINMINIYKDWQPGEVEKYEPKVNIDEIKSFLTGIGK